MENVKETKENVKETKENELNEEALKELSNNKGDED